MLTIQARPHNPESIAIVESEIQTVDIHARLENHFNLGMTESIQQDTIDPG